MNPMLAVNAITTSLRFRLIAQPKIDGVRGWNPAGKLLGRSMEPHANKQLTKFFSDEKFRGFDGELYVGDATAESVCRKTTSVVNTVNKVADVRWSLFDLVRRDTFFLPYEDRLRKLEEYVSHLYDTDYQLWQRIEVIPYKIVNDLDELLALEHKYIAEGYEGIILRDPAGAWRSGRCTPESNALLRIKRFEDREGEVLDVKEGFVNNNMQTYGADGMTKRSTHAENMIPSGTVGSLVVRDSETGKIVTVSKGKLSAVECQKYFAHPALIIGKIITYRVFPRGSVRAPRFPTFQNFRASSDISTNVC